MNFRSNKQRREYWNEVQQTHTPQEIKEALARLSPDTVRVLLLHYEETKSFIEITSCLGRSISFVRTHHNRGIFKLYKHFRPTVEPLLNRPHD